MNFWNIAGLSPTKDERKIKKAYAELIKVYTPHEYPNEFKEIREAYEEALRYADEDNFNNTSTIVMYENQNLDEQEVDNEEGRFDFSFGERSGLSKEIEREVDKLIELFSSESREEWIKHITSDEFLYTFRNKEFLKRIYDLATISKLINEDGTLKNSIARNYLKIAYAVSDEFEYIFEGVEYIDMLIGDIEEEGEIADDIVLSKSFKDYYLMWKAAYLEGFNFANIKMYSQILGGYISWNLVDETSDIDINKNKKLAISMNLIKNIFKNYELPKDVYMIALKQLGLNKKVKIDYKHIYDELREIITQKSPEIINQDIKKSNFNNLNKDILKLKKSSMVNSDETKSRIDELFAREDIRAAFHSLTYIIEELEDNLIIKFNSWQDINIYIMFMKKLYEIIDQDMKVPYREDVKEIIYKSIRKEELSVEASKDITITEISDEDMTVYNRAFFRYYMNVAFPNVKVEGIKFLSSYIQSDFKFSRTYAELIGNDNRSISLTIVDQDISIYFHKFYTEYVIDGMIPFCPVFRFTELFHEGVDLENINQNLFWILLPKCYDTYENEEHVFESILGRLNHLGYQGERIQGITRIISRNMCKYDNVDELREITIIGENDTKSYFCDMDLSESVVYIIEKTDPWRYKCIDSVEIEAENLQEFVDICIELLQESIDMNDEFKNIEFKMMPTALEYVSGGNFDSSLFINDPYNNRYINNPSIEEIEWMFDIYKDGKVMFFMLHFEDEKTKQKRILTMGNYMNYGCFCHDVGTSTRYALINPKEKSSDKQKFFLSPIEKCLSHRMYTEIIKNLQAIIDDVCDFTSAELKGEFWAKETFDYANVGNNRKEAFELDRIVLAGQEFANYSNPIYMENLLLYRLPKEILITNKEGSSELREYEGNRCSDTEICKHEEIRNIIEKALDNKLKEIIVTWYDDGSTDYEKVNQSQMIIRNDTNGNSMLIVVDYSNNRSIVLKNYDYVKKDLQSNVTDFLNEEVNSGLVIGSRTLEDRLYLRNIIQILLVNMESISEFIYYFVDAPTGYGSGRFMEVDKVIRG